MKAKNVCGRKVSFHTKAAAQKAADAFNQTVYSCPVCFCYHCTSKPDWRQEFYTQEQVDQIKLEASFGSKKKRAALNTKINVLQKENRDIRKENGRLRHEIGQKRCEVCGHKPKPVLLNLIDQPLLEDNSNEVS